MKPPKSKQIEEIQIHTRKVSQPKRVGQLSVVADVDAIKTIPSIVFSRANAKRADLNFYQAHITNSQRVLDREEAMLQEEIESARKSVADAIEYHKRNIEQFKSRLKEFESKVPRDKLDRLSVEYSQKLKDEIELFKKCAFIDNFTVTFEERDDALKITIGFVDGLVTAPTITFSDSATYSVPQIKLPISRIHLYKGGAQVEFGRNLGGQLKYVPFCSGSGNMMGRGMYSICLGQASAEYQLQFSDCNYYLAFLTVLKILRSVFNGESGYNKSCEFINAEENSYLFTAAKFDAGKHFKFRINNPRVILGRVYNGDNTPKDGYLLEVWSVGDAYQLKLLMESGNIVQVPFYEEFVTPLSYTPTAKSPTEYLQAWYRDNVDKEKLDKLASIKEKSHKKIAPRVKRVPNRAPEDAGAPSNMSPEVEEMYRMITRTQEPIVQRWIRHS